MATKTLGTNGTTTLTALAHQSAGNAQADVATIMQAILDDGMVFPAGGSNPGNISPLSVQPRHQAGSSTGPYPGAYQINGLLIIPNRGVLRVLPGDWVGVDANGWPILVSAAAIAGTYASTSWTHS